MLLIGLLLIYGLSAQDVQEKANYTIIQLEVCPDEGYIFKKEVSLNGKPGACNLCFCGNKDNAVCWKREVSRCDAEKYHMHGIGKRNTRITRSLGFADIFLRDATREIFNRQEPQQCVPFKESKSEGCPPADWCLGCTVCDCDANGRWACHTLSFCNDKKSKKKHKSNVRLDLLEYPLPQPTKSTPKPPKTSTMPLRMKWKRVRSPEKLRKKNLRKKLQAMSKSQAKVAIWSNKNTSKNVTKRLPPKKGTVSVQKSNKTIIFTNNLSSKKLIKNNTRKVSPKDGRINLRNDQKPKSLVKQLNTNVVGKQPLFKNDMFSELIKDNKTAAVAQKVMENIMSVLKKIAIRDIAKQRFDQAVKNAKNGGLFKDNEWRNCTLANKMETATLAPINVQDFFNKINLRPKRQVNDSYAVLNMQSNAIVTDVSSNHTITFDIPNTTKSSHIPSTLDISNYSSKVTNKNTTQANDNYYTYSIEKANVTKTYQRNQDNDTVTVFELKMDGEKTADTSNKTNSGYTFIKEKSIPTEKMNVTENYSDSATTEALYNLTNSVYRNQVTAPFNIVKVIFPKNIEKKIVQEVSLKKYFKVKKNRLCDNSVQMNDPKLIENCQILTKTSEGGKKKTFKTNILSYLKKIFKSKLYFPRKNKIVKIKKTLSTYHRVLNILCNKYNLCGSEIKPSPQLESKLKKLSKEGNQIMRSIKIIAGLLKLIDLPNLLNRTNEEVGKMETRRESEIENLYYILTEKYNNENNRINLTETQLNQIEYVKSNTRVFINSVNKFARILNDIVHILNKNKLKTGNSNKIHSITEAELKDEIEAFNDASIVKNKNDEENKTVLKKITSISKQQNSVTTNKSNTILIDQIKKMKVLFQNYNKMQNQFFKKVIESLDNLRGSSIKSITTEASATNSLSKSTQIDVYSNKIIQNLRKLKDLASKLNIKRTKRSVMNENELDYMLMLMEKLMIQQKQVFPVHDGIDLLIEVIKQAPEIKKIKYFSPVLTTKPPNGIQIFNSNKWIQTSGVTKASQKKTKTTETINKSDSSLLDDNSIESTSESNYKDDDDTESASADLGDQNKTLERNERREVERKGFPKTYNYTQSTVNEDNVGNDINKDDGQTSVTGSEMSTKVNVYSFKPHKSSANIDLVSNTNNFILDDNANDSNQTRAKLFVNEDGIEDIRKVFYNVDSNDDDVEDEDYSTPKLVSDMETEAAVSTKSDSIAGTSSTLVKTRYEVKRKPSTTSSFKLIQWFEDSNEENATRTTPRLVTRTRKVIKVSPSPTIKGLVYSKKKKNEVLQKKQFDLLKSLDYETEKIDKSDEAVIKWVETRKDKFSSEADDNIAIY